MGGGIGGREQSLGHESNSFPDDNWVKASFSRLLIQPQQTAIETRNSEKAVSSKEKGLKSHSAAEKLELGKVVDRGQMSCQVAKAAAGLQSVFPP